MSDKSDLVELVQRTVYPRHVKDLPKAGRIILNSVIGSYAPDVAPLAPNMVVACIGSCFADEMATSLKNQGKAVAPLILSERWNTAFAVRHFVEYGLDNTPFPESFIPPSFGADSRAYNDLRASDAYIVTLGLSLCWYELRTNRMILEVEEGHSAKHLASILTTHAMRQTSVAQNVEQIAAIVASIRRAKPTAPIIFTLSPIPLLLSLTDYPSVASNTISKATLRIALHEIMERNLDNVFYWPSYEIVEWMGKYLRPIWGQEGNDLRHLPSSVIEDVMRLFAKFYFAPTPG